MRQRLIPLLAAALSILAGCRRPEPEPPPEGAPRLVLFVVVDQVRADYLERFRPLWSGGLARLMSEGTTFTDAHQYHAQTVTGVGHATLATGMLPRHHGIVGNGWFDRELGKVVEAVTDQKHGESPNHLLVPTLGDYMKARYPDAKVFGIGGKDRSAIFTSGRNADLALWYDRREGTFETSSYYAAVERPWLDELNESHYLDRYFGTTWSPRLSLEELAPYDIEPVDRGTVMDGQFPHPLGGLSAYPDSSFYGAIFNTPLVDEYVVELAKSLIDGESLGADDVPDFLGVTLAAVDTVGHAFGPNSPELADALLTVDRVLADLLDFVDQRIGLEHVAVSLSSDHGVGAIPELLHARGDETARRFDAPELTCFQALGERLTEKFGEGPWLVRGLYFNRELIADSGIDTDALEQTIIEYLEGCPGIERVYSGRHLETASQLDETERLFFNSYHPERSGDLVVLTSPNTLTSWSVAASHGTPYPYDTHVPWLLRLPSHSPTLVAEQVHTVDVVPTLAPLLGLELAGLDGTNRAHLLAGPLRGE